MDGDFSCQKSEIPGKSISRDHAGEQVNRIIKNRVGITGITKNENARTRYFLIAPILCSISEQMLKLGGVLSPSSRSHHQLTQSYTRQQNQRITSLLNVFEIHLNLSDKELPFFNMITGQIFPDDVFNSIVSFEDIGEDLYRQFVNERLKPESAISILSPLQKANLKTCKSANKKRL